MSRKLKWSQITRRNAGGYRETVLGGDRLALHDPLHIAKRKLADPTITDDEWVILYYDTAMMCLKALSELIQTKPFPSELATKILKPYVSFLLPLMRHTFGNRKRRNFPLHLRKRYTKTV